jgi:hypothetical protein
VTSVAAPERRETAPSAHLVTCAYCKSIVSPVLARLGSVGCHTCRSIHGV